MQRTEPPQTTTAAILFLSKEQAESVNSALARFLLLIETSQTEVSELFRGSLQSVLSSLAEARSQAVLLHPTDVEALERLAQLNYAQQQCDQVPEGCEERAQAEEQFNRAFMWLQLHHYPTHRDQRTALWRSGAYVGRKDS